MCIERLTVTKAIGFLIDAKIAQAAGKDHTRAANWSAELTMRFKALEHAITELKTKDKAEPK